MLFFIVDEQIGWAFSVCEIAAMREGLLTILLN